MSEAKFTKGEWKISDSEGVSRFVYALNENYTNQFSLLIEGNGFSGADNDELTANANLIKSAPKLYEKLKLLVEESRLVYGEDYDEIDDLLAEARGEV